MWKNANLAAWVAVEAVRLLCNRDVCFKLRLRLSPSLERLIRTGGTLGIRLSRPPPHDCCARDRENTRVKDHRGPCSRGVFELNRLKIASFAAGLAALSLVAGEADAHARLVSATPTAGAEVAAPRTISLTFSERVAPAFSGFDVVNAAGVTIRVQTRVSEDGKTISGAPARPLSTGAYVVNWRVASPDGHRMTGTTNFSVR